VEESCLWAHEQLISNGGRLKLAFAERDKKQTMIDHAPRNLDKLFLKTSEDFLGYMRALEDWSHIVRTCRAGLKKSLSSLLLQGLGSAFCRVFMHLKKLNLYCNSFRSLTAHRA
jgi:hypothetical protein